MLFQALNASPCHNGRDHEVTNGQNSKEPGLWRPSGTFKKRRAFIIDGNYLEER